MPKVHDTATPKYELYSEWLEDNYKLEIDALDLQHSIQFYSEFQASEENKAFNAERAEANAAKREEAKAERTSKKSTRKSKAADAEDADSDEDESDEDDAPAPRSKRRSGSKVTPIKKAAAKKTTRRKPAEDAEEEF